jgi:hypothetical protein
MPELNLYIKNNTRTYTLNITKDNFNKFDSNGDGRISQDEFLDKINTGKNVNDSRQLPATSDHITLRIGRNALLNSRSNVLENTLNNINDALQRGENVELVIKDEDTGSSIKCTFIVNGKEMKQTDPFEPQVTYRIRDYETKQPLGYNLYFEKIPPEEVIYWPDSAGRWPNEDGVTNGAHRYQLTKLPGQDDAYEFTYANGEKRTLYINTGEVVLNVPPENSVMLAGIK